MDDFLNLLSEFFETDKHDNLLVQGNDGKYFGANEANEEENELISKLEGFCDEYLITSGGGCNWDNIGILRSKGYSVYAGEKDSFGWLIGCIEKNGKIYCYG